MKKFEHLNIEAYNYLKEIEMKSWSRHVFDDYSNNQIIP